MSDVFITLLGCMSGSHLPVTAATSHAAALHKLHEFVDVTSFLIIYVELHHISS